MSTKTSSAEHSVGAVPPARRSRPRSELVRLAFPYLLLTPFFVLLTLFFIAPILFAFRTSLFERKLIGGESFVWFEQYVRALQDERLWRGLLNTAAFGAVFIVVLLVLATAAALVLDARASRFHRLAVFVPYAVPSAVAALMWGYLYSDQFGPLAQLGDTVGLASPDFLGPNLIIFSLVNIVIWQFVGYNMLILYVALSGISRELYEAARVDGANPWQIAWMIKLPLIRPALGLVVFFSFIGSLQLFNEPEILSAIAPDVINSSFTPNLYAYSVAFANRELSYSAAISFIVGGIAMLGALVFGGVANRRRNRS